MEQRGFYVKEEFDDYSTKFYKMNSIIEKLEALPERMNSVISIKNDIVAETKL